MNQSQPRYIDVDVEDNENCWPLHRVFQTLGSLQTINTVDAPDPMGVDAICSVTGWSAEGPCPAYAVLVSDSGEGSVTLIFGGDEGIRLKPVANEEDWDLSNPNQWGEPCLLLDPDVEMG